MSEGHVIRIHRRRISAMVIAILISPILILSILSFMAKSPRHLGVVDGQLVPCPNSPNCVSSQASDPEHSIQALTFSGSPDSALKRLKHALDAIPRLKIVEEQGNYLRAEATSFLFRFVDDVEFLVDTEAGVIHVRSASRVGHSDLGKNRERIETIRKAFQQADASESGSL